MMNDDIVLTLALDERDNTACVAGPCTWEQFVSLSHHRRDDKFRRDDGRPTGFTPATFRAGACTCGKPPRVASGSLPAQRGCPDHPLNNAIGAPRGHRIAANVELVTVVMLDLDKTPEGTDITAELAGEYITRIQQSGLDAVVWSSHSFDAAAKFNLRGGIRLSRPVTPAEYRRLLPALIAWLGVTNGFSGADPRRFWFFPSAREGAPVVHVIARGVPLDVDAFLASLPPEPERSPSEVTQVPRDAVVPPEDAQQRAIEILAAAWPPVGTRSAARGELAGALAWAGWDEESIVRFLDGVAAATNGGIVDGDVHSNNCRWASASVSKIEGGGVSGWPSLAIRLGQDVVDATKRALGMTVQITEEQSLELDSALADVLAATHASMPEPPDDFVNSCIEGAQMKLGRRTGAVDRYTSKLLKRVVAGELLTERPTEDPLAALRAAALAVARAAPAGTKSGQLQSRLLSSAGNLADQLPQIVDEAMYHAMRMPPLVAPEEPREPKERAVPVEGEFELDAKGNREGRPTNNSGKNMRLALGKLGIQMSYDMFKVREYIRRGDGPPAQWEDIHHKQLRDELERTFDFKPPKDEFVDLLEVVAREHTFHSVLDYLGQVQPTWDGVPRIDEWLIHAGAPDTPYVRAVSRIVLVAAVRRARQPGALYQEIVVLESPQGHGKSTALRALVHDEDLFTDNLELGMEAKKIIEQTQGKWIIEIPEMHKRGADSLVKACLSRQVDEARMAYGRKNTIARRGFVLLGTTNEGGTGYLYDTTGNRRYWPVAVEGFDVAALIAMRDQLWAEAAVAEAAGESIRLAKELWPDAAVEQEKRRVKNPIETLLVDALDGRVGRIKVRDVWELARVDMIGKGRPSNVECGEINAVMARMGWLAKEKIAFGGERLRGFVKGTEEEQEVVLTASGGLVGQVYAPGAQGRITGEVVN